MTWGGAAAALLRFCCARRAALFARALNDIETAQRLTLNRILRASATTQYGRSVGLSATFDVDQFRARTPIVDYAVLKPWIERQRATGGSVLTPGKARCYEPTSGSSGRAKYIPYNGALLGSFRALFAVWAHDLLAHVLRPRSGKTFMSLSSPLRGQEGFADDREYLGAASRLLIGRLLVMPPRVASGQSPEAWRDALACALVASGDLEIISIWNPSYLLNLLDHFAQHRARLMPALPAARRAVAERDPLVWSDVWPQLQLISCWCDAAAVAPAARLGSLFPRARVQGKGLIATEAPVTVPLISAGGCVPFVDEVFIELEDQRGGHHLLHEAEEGVHYELVISQAGGLMRYRLGDRVRVTGKYRGVPLIAFAGRARRATDLVGEKLDETLVARVLAGLVRKDGFFTLLPVLPEQGKPYYWLLTDDPRSDLAQLVDSGLMQALRYREARFLGQLDAVRATHRAEMRRAVHDALNAAGIKAGDIKDHALLAPLELAQRVRMQLPPVQPSAR